MEEVAYEVCCDTYISNMQPVHAENLSGHPWRGKQWVHSAFSPHYPQKAFCVTQRRTSPVCIATHFSHLGQWASKQGKTQAHESLRSEALLT